MSSEGRKSGSFIKQAAILAAAGILVRVVGFLYRLPLTNMIGDKGNAIYSAGYYIYTFLLILSSAGLPAAISKMVSERLAVNEYQNAHKVFRVSLVISATLGFIFMMILLLFAKPLSDIVNSPESYWCIITLSPTLFIVAVMSVYRGYFQGMHTMIPTAISQIVEQVFHAVFSVYLAYVFLRVGVSAGEKNIVLGAAGGTAGTGIGALAGLVIMFLAYAFVMPALKRKRKRESGTYRKESNTEIAKVLMRTALPIIAGTAVFSMTNLIDMVMVTQRLQDAGFSYADTQVMYGQLSGKYVTLTTLPVSITTAMATAAIPAIAAAVKLRDKESVKRKINLLLRIAMILSVPAAVGLGVLGDPIIKLLFPSAQEGGSLLTVGAIAIIFLALCQIVTGVLQGIGRVAVPVMGALLGAVTKIILNYFLIAIPQINVLGAVLSTTGCYLVASIFNLYVLSRVTKVKPDLVGSLVKPLLASVVMGLFCFGTYRLLFGAFANNIVATVAAILIGAIVYGITLIVIKGLKEEDLHAIPMGTKLIPILKRAHLLL